MRLVNSYLDDLVQMIVSEYTPEEICVAIRMCAPKQEKITNNELPPVLNEVVSMYWYCSYVAQGFPVTVTHYIA